MLGCICPVGGVSPWVHVRESAGVYVLSGRGYTMGTREGECWGVCAQCEGLYTMGAREGECWDVCAQWEGLYTMGARGGGAREGEC